MSRDLSPDDKYELYQAAVTNYKSSKKNSTAEAEFRNSLLRLGFGLKEIEDQLGVYRCQ